MNEDLKYGMVLIDEDEVEHELIFTKDAWKKIFDAVKIVIPDIKG